MDHPLNITAFFKEDLNGSFKVRLKSPTRETCFQGQDFKDAMRHLAEMIEELKKENASPGLDNLQSRVQITFE